MDWTTIITAVIGLLGGGAITALYNAKTERKNSDVDNDTKLYNEYQEYINVLKEDNKDVRAELDESRSQFKTVIEELNTLKKRVGNIERKLIKSQTLLVDAREKACDKALTCPNRVCPSIEQVSDILQDIGDEV